MTNYLEQPKLGEFFIEEDVNSDTEFRKEQQERMDATLPI